MNRKISIILAALTFGVGLSSCTSISTSTSTSTADKTPAPVEIVNEKDKFLGEGNIKDVGEFIDAQKPHYIFAQIADPQIGQKSEEVDQGHFNKVIDEINELKIKRVFITGDLVNHNIETEWDRYIESVKRFNAIVHPVPGNHDVLYVYDNFVEDGYKNKHIEEPEKAALALELFKRTEKEVNGGALSSYIKYTGEQRSRYTIEVKEMVFITIPTLTKRIEKSDLEWLKNELERTKDASHVFIFAHYPVLEQFGRNVPSESGGKVFQSLLKKYKVAGFITGHRHRLLTAKVDETMHLVSPQPKKGYFIYLVFKDSIKAVYKSSYSNDFEVFSFDEPRGIK